MKQMFNNEIAGLTSVMEGMPWDDRNFYAHYLAQTFYFVQHSTRLLALAGGNTALSEDSLHRRFSSHIAEEKGHDRIALNDLKKLGIHRLPAEAVATMNLYETQYYKIERQHPAALFGYILALEGVASLICPRFIEKIYQAHGIEAARFLKLHVEEDPDHVDKALEVIAGLPADQQDPIRVNLRQSLWNYRLFLEECRRLSLQEPVETAVAAGLMM